MHVVPTLLEHAADHAVPKAVVIQRLLEIGSLVLGQRLEELAHGACLVHRGRSGPDVIQESYCSSCGV